MMASGAVQNSLCEWGKTGQIGIRDKTTNLRQKDSFLLIVTADLKNLITQNEL